MDTIIVVKPNLKSPWAGWASGNDFDILSYHTKTPVFTILIESTDVKAKTMFEGKATRLINELFILAGFDGYSNTFQKEFIIMAAGRDLVAHEERAAHCQN